MKRLSSDEPGRDGPSSWDPKEVPVKSIRTKESIPPMSLLTALSAFRELNPGEIIEVRTADPDMARDLSLIVERSGDLRIESMEYGDEFRIRVRKH